MTGAERRSGHALPILRRYDSEPRKQRTRPSLPSSRCGLLPRPVHPVGRLEIFPGMGDEPAVAVMIVTLPPGNDVHQSRFMVVNVLHQLGLCVGGSGDENFPRVSE